MSHRCSDSGSNRFFRSVYRSPDPRIKRKTFGAICSLSVIRIILLAKSQVRFLRVHGLLSTPSDPFLQKSSNNRSEASSMKMGWVAFNPSFYQMEGKCHVHNSKLLEISLPLNLPEARSIISSLGPPWEGLKQMIYLLNINNKLRLGN